MTALSADDAIALARTTLDANNDVPGRAWLVRRLDRPPACYYLVVLGKNDAAVGVCAVDADNGNVESSARLPGTTTHGILELQEATDLAGFHDVVNAELVWKPCFASRSTFYPLWAVESTNAKVYVDQQGNVWTDLNTRRPAG